MTIINESGLYSLVLRSRMQGLSKTIKGLVGVAASVQAIRALGTSFINAATQMEGDQTKLRAVIKDSSAADKTSVLVG
jgi:prophage antirepressor-like protein